MTSTVEGRFPWRRMQARPRRSMADLKAGDIPGTPGVYALYRDGQRMHVGKADCLCNRMRKNHSGRGAVMTSFALRRNVAGHLGIATSDDIKARSYQPPADEVAAVRAWLDGCDIACTGIGRTWTMACCLTLSETCVRATEWS